MLELAREEAARADMILVSMDRDIDVTGALSTRIKSLLSTPSNSPCALVALLGDKEISTKSSALLFLRGLAESEKLAFFTNVETYHSSLFEPEHAM
jgi:hypothetical protein